MQPVDQELRLVGQEIAADGNGVLGFKAKTLDDESVRIVVEDGRMHVRDQID